MLCLGPWMNHLPSVCWSTFRVTFSIVSWYESLIRWRGVFLLISCLYSCFLHYPSSAYSFPLISIYSQIAFYTKYFVLTFSIDVVSPLSNMNKILTKVLYMYMQHAIIFTHSSVFLYIVFLIIVGCGILMLAMIESSGRLNIKMLPYQYRDSRYREETVLWRSHLYKWESLYQKFILRWGQGSYIWLKFQFLLPLETDRHPFFLLCKISKRLDIWNGCFGRTRFREIRV